MTGEFYTSPEKNLGVSIKHPENANFYMEGDVRLLDLAVNVVAMGKLMSHVKTLDTKDFDLVVAEINTALAKDGFTVTMLEHKISEDDLEEFTDPDIKDTLYFAKKNYKKLREKLNVTYLLLLEINRAGVARPYQGFIPLEEPRAVFELKVQIVDLSTNKLVWYQDISAVSFSTGEWDEPPQFPGLTNSFYIALESAKVEIVDEILRASAQKASTQQASTTNAPVPEASPTN